MLVCSFTPNTKVQLDFLIPYLSILLKQLSIISKKNNLSTSVNGYWLAGCFVFRLFSSSPLAFYLFIVINKIIYPFSSFCPISSTIHLTGIQSGHSRCENRQQPISPMPPSFQAESLIQMLFSYSRSFSFIILSMALSMASPRCVPNSIFLPFIKYNCNPIFPFTL